MSETIDQDASGKLAAPGPVRVVMPRGVLCQEMILNAYAAASGRPLPFELVDPDDLKDVTPR